MASTKRTEEPFDLPETWVWARLGSLGEIVGGGTPKSGEPRFWSEGGVPWLTPADLNGYTGKRIGQGRRGISQEGLESSSARLLPAETVLFSSRAPIGYVAITSNPLATNQGFKSIIPYTVGFAEYLYWFLKQAGPGIDASASGTTFREVSGKAVSQIIVPLPPKAEQRRIVARVDELMALCDRLSDQIADRDAHRRRWATSTVRHISDDEAIGSTSAWDFAKAHFDALVDTPETVPHLRRLVLNLAVQGKLVPVDPDDEPAADVRLGDLLAEPSRNGYSGSPAATPPGVPLLRISAGTSRSDFTVNEADHKYARVDDRTAASFEIRPDDLLSCRYNGNLHYVGLFSLYLGATGEQQMHPDKLIRFRLDPAKALPRYVLYAMNAPKQRDAIEALCATTAGNIGISARKLNDVVLRVPPLAEQHRIVERVEVILALCDQLSEHLAAAENNAARLMRVVLGEALVGSASSTIAV